MAKSDNPFHSFDHSPKVILVGVLMNVKFPLSVRNLDDLQAERGIDICHETVRLC
jgi:putative transposase